jgi:hypothetical protein
VKLLITMFFTLSRFPSLLFKYYPQRPVLRHSKSYWPTWSERSSPRPIQNRWRHEKLKLSLLTGHGGP